MRDDYPDFPDDRYEGSIDDDSFGEGSFGRGSFDDGRFGPPPSSRSAGRGTRTLVVLLIAGFGFLASCCVICGGIMALSVSASKDQARAQYGNDPRVIDAIGAVEDVEWKLRRTAEEVDRSGRRLFVFDLVGETGRAELIVELVGREEQRNGKMFKNGRLKLRDGRQLLLDEEANPFGRLQQTFEDLLDRLPEPPPPNAPPEPIVRPGDDDEEPRPRRRLKLRRRTDGPNGASGPNEADDDDAQPEI